MNNERIKDIALANDFKLKEQPSGEIDLDPYVYDFARTLLLLKLGEITADMTDFIDSKDMAESQHMLDRCDAVVARHITELSEAQDD